MSLYPILNLTQFDKQLEETEFYANTFADHLECFHTAITIPHKHDFYLVVYFTKGRGKHEVDFREYSIEPGALFCMQPGQTHHWEFTESPEGYIFFHSAEFYQMYHPIQQLGEYPMFFSVQKPALIPIKPGLKYPEYYMQNILREYKENHPYRRQKVAGLIDLLYLELAREILGSVNITELSVSKMPATYRKLETLIDLHYITIKKASEYASMLAVSTKHLNKIVMATIGRTTTDLIHDRILLEAKRILVRQEKTVKEVAELLGYDDPAYFTRLFSKKCGVAPGKFAEKYLL